MRKIQLVALACLLATTPLQAAIDGPRQTLEHLLASQREAAAAKLEEAREEVNSIVTTMRSLGGDKANFGRISSLSQQLIEFGGSITPLLLPALVGPEKQNTLDRKLTAQIALVLTRMPIAPILGDLIALADKGGDDARKGAISVLGYCNEPGLVGPQIARIFREEPAFKPAALRALCFLGGPDAAQVLDSVLADADTMGKQKEVSQLLIAEALNALAESITSGSPATPSQIAFLRSICNSRAGGDLLPQVVKYIKALPAGSLDENDTRKLIAMAADRMNPLTKRILLLDNLPNLGVPYKRGMDEGFNKIINAGNPGLVEAGLICLARFGDKSAKKQLLKPYKEKIAERRNDPAPYEARGTVLVRLGDYGAAIVDFKKTIKLNNADKRRSPYASNAAYIGMARAHCLDGDLRAASKDLRDSALSTVQLRNLATDPDFAALLADPRYNGAFSL